MRAGRKSMFLLQREFKKNHFHVRISLQMKLNTEELHLFMEIGCNSVEHEVVQGLALQQGVARWPLLCQVVESLPRLCLPGVNKPRGAPSTCHYCETSRKSPPENPRARHIYLLLVFTVAAACAEPGWVIPFPRDPRGGNSLLCAPPFVH